ALFVEQGPVVVRALAALRTQQRPATVDLRYVERILAAFSTWRAPTSAGEQQDTPSLPCAPASEPLVEALTERELEVLRLMAHGLKYKEIAADLFISLNTVRFHAKSIYGKLQANNRTQALERARQFRIL
ncbi:MAG TPA: response regulator transcription factor, partial [Anaerolineae bacterium]|nr:response regulator transcription factor [Anaerolineae bacterium]